MIRKHRHRRRHERPHQNPKVRKRETFRRACRVARSIEGSLTERAAYALGYLGSNAGFGWEEIKKMLGER
jgi:hypothetical protein